MAKARGMVWAVTTTAILLAACADQKGFRARVTTPDDVLKARIANGEILAGGRDHRAEAGAISISIPALSESGTAGSAAGSSGPTVQLTDEDRLVMNDFVQVVSRDADQKAADSRAAARSGDGKSAAVDAAAEKMKAKLAEIRAALRADAATVIRGIDVRLTRLSAGTTSREATRFKIAVDLRVAATQNVTVSGEGELSVLDQIGDSRLAELRLKTIDDRANQLAVRGLEVFAACAVEDCEEVHILVLITRQDQAKTAMIGKFKFDGTSLGTSLGNQLRSVRDAIAAETAVAAAPAAPSAVAAPAASEADKAGTAAQGGAGSAAETPAERQWPFEGATTADEPNLRNKIQVKSLAPARAAAEDRQAEEGEAGKREAQEDAAREATKQQSSIKGAICRFLGCGGQTTNENGETVDASPFTGMP